MAKFLITTGISYHLEELIKNTQERLILISPYLQLNQKIKDHITNLNIQKKDIRIIYRENKLQIDESEWLEDKIGIRTSVLQSLHAKCYLNEKECIVTSMNLYSFSKENNDEMGIHILKNEDPELYNDIYADVQRLLNISNEIRVSVKKVAKEKETEKIVKKNNKEIFLTTKEISEKSGKTSRNINDILQKKGYMYKENDDWLTTKKGSEIGIIQEGKYGKFVIWNENILTELN